MIEMAFIKNKIFFWRIILSGICLLFLAVTFHTENRSSGWYQQYLPAGINNNINDLKFTDSLTGYISTANDSFGVSYLLKTTNGGDNWFTMVRDTTGNIYSNFQFFNKDTAYIKGYDQIYKTTNAGLNWIHQCYLPGVTAYYAINLDTIFSISDISIIGGLWRTTNGGTSWTQLVNFGSCNPEKIYFFNKYNGYMAKCNEIWKSSDCGANWFYLASGNWLDIHFLDSLNGYKADGGVRKTTDGGYNWIQQQLPVTHVSGMGKINLVNYDTIWGIGGVIYNNGYIGIIYKSTNGGSNWGYQVPLNNNSISVYQHIKFVNAFKGWAYRIANTGVHTTIGGNDTTFFTGMKLVEEYTPKGYTLGQNYPNPFNPSTNIPFELSESGYIILKVYDITGRTIKELVNGRWGKASYVVDFNGTNLPSGIYFYRIEITGDYTKALYTETKKMLLIK